jgi:nicotinate-nucleotide--dimethylbenzimidazole phosphoribosyltransferase
MLEVAVQLEQPAVEEQVAGQQEQPLAPAAEKPTVVAAVAAEVEAANGMPAAEAPAEAEPAAEPVPQEYTAAAELAAAELTADAAEEEAATAAPAALEPVHPTAADSWGAVLAAANQPYVAPQAVEAPAPSSNNGDTSAAAEESEFASAHGGPASQDGEPAVPVAAEPVAAPEAAGAAEESPAAASWRSVLAVANQPFVALQPTAVAEAAKTTNGAAAEGDSAPAATATAAAPEAAVEGAELPATQPSNNGSKPAAAQAEPEAAPAAAPKQAPAQLAPAANSPSSGKPKGLAPWLRLLLAAAVVLAAIILFMKSPWAAVRWALSAV